MSTTGAEMSCQERAEMSTINQVASRGVCECNGGCGIGSGNKLAYSTSRVDFAAIIWHVA